MFLATEMIEILLPAVLAQTERSVPEVPFGDKMLTALPVALQNILMEFHVAVGKYVLFLG